MIEVGPPGQHSIILKLSIQIPPDELAYPVFDKSVKRQQSSRRRQGDLGVHARIRRQVDLRRVASYYFRKPFHQIGFALVARAVLLHQHAALPMAAPALHDMLLYRPNNRVIIYLPCRQGL